MSNRPRIVLEHVMLEAPSSETPTACSTRGNRKDPPTFILDQASLCGRALGIGARGIRTGPQSVVDEGLHGAPTHVSPVEISLRGGDAALCSTTARAVLANSFQTRF